jgi:tRNA pseudouridine55 synthase
VIPDGVLSINKPAGMTSHDVVAQVRKILGEKRIGHTGTLDPLATGVLVLCIGKATRIAQFLEAGEKEYRATLKLGVTTDTLDSEGRVLDTTTYVRPADEKLLEVLKSFTGRIMQTPPVYSAIKIGGIPSYKLARQGKAEELKARAVTIHSIDLTAYDDPFVQIAVRCSKGVYIRSLCADIGKALGMGAHLTSLTRTRSGRFTLQNSVTLDQVRLSASEGIHDRGLVSIDEALEDMPAVTFDEDEAKKISQGGRVVKAGAGGDGEGLLVRVHTVTGKLVALARTGCGEFRPEIVFFQNN